LGVERSYRLVVKRDAIVVCGRDERGAGQGCYYLEDLMNLREAPFLQLGDEARAPVFQPRMIHSGWGIDLFPDPHLNAIAHAGIDAILVFVKGPNRTTVGHLDINDLIDRAAACGLDVYLYSYLHSSKHPDDYEAAAFYDSTYGALMRAHPRAKGLVLVGESCEFPSKDERTKGRTRHCPVPENAPPDSRPFPGWWPCRDYPQWLDLVKGVVRKVNPAADVVFWTYNWGWAPEADRLALIRTLPKDLSLEVTFEMFENVEKEGIVTRCVDYTASFAGPGGYFSSEAKTAKECGIPLYAMSNTGGLTWDIGVIPYEPIPYQWRRRHDALLEANRKWGLRGLMESHHFGFWPSFVSELAKWSYWHPRRDFDEAIRQIAARDFGEGADFALQAWQHWSEAFLDYVPTNEDQYGPFRVGPAYPLVFLDQDVAFPSADYAHFGSRIVKTLYRSHKPADVPVEIRLLRRLVARWDQGLSCLGKAFENTPERKRAKARELLRLGEFIRNCVVTTIHVKRWFLEQQVLREPAGEPAVKRAALARMREIAGEELRNVAATLPLVEADSRLGWEPSMEYMTDPAHLEWKLAQVRQVLQETMPAYEQDNLAGK
ncbi:MAG: hypothetical protein RBU25_12635, partial [Lentisphaeria bacterium]|nr:hypothetical protein [Lentisphaeria bacterium]